MELRNQLTVSDLVEQCCVCDNFRRALTQGTFQWRCPKKKLSGTIREIFLTIEKYVANRSPIDLSVPQLRHKQTYPPHRINGIQLATCYKRPITIARTICYADFDRNSKSWSDAFLQQVDREIKPIILGLHRRYPLRKSGSLLATL